MSKRIPKLRLHKPTRRGVVTLSGKDIYLGSWPVGRKNPPDEVVEAYNTAVHEWLASGIPGAKHPVPAIFINPSVSTVTVAELIARFWEHAQGYFQDADGKPTSDLNAYRVALRPLRKLYQSVPVADFGPLKLKAVREAFILAGLARVNVNAHVGRIKRMFRWGVANEIVPPGVLQGLLAIEGLRRGRGDCREGRKIAPVPAELVERTLPFLSGPVRPLVEILSLTGMRSGEACVMRPADINRDGDVWIYAPSKHKTANRGHVRSVALGPKSQAVLSPLIEGLDPEEYVFSPARWVSEQNAARSEKRKTKRWPSHMARNIGKRSKTPKRKARPRYTPITVAQAVRRACEKASPIPEGADSETAKAWEAANWWHVHRLRHTFATAARKAVGTEAASAALGHAGLKVTEVYAERDEALAAKVARLLG